MALNLLEAVQKKLNYPPLQKIDPNTQQVATDNSKPDEHRFSQAAIPAVLTGLYKYSTTDEGAEKILSGDISTDWVNNIFGNTENEVADKIAAYSYSPVEPTHARMDTIAAAAINLIRENIKEGATKMDVKNFMSGQKHDILLFLPAALHTGDILNDDTLDDNTNKMEGPISSLMHKIGSAFSNPPDEDEIKKKEE